MRLNSLESNPGVAGASPALGATGAHALLVLLLRFGFVVRGVIYMVPGVLALRLASGRPGADMTTSHAIEVIGQQPFGRFLVVAVAVGLGGYAMWGVIRAVFDPLGRGESPHGLAQRFGFALSAIAYAGLLAATLRSLGAVHAHLARPRDWIAVLLGKPLGALMVGVVGVCWIAGAGLGQIASGWSGRFERDLDRERMSAAERRWASRLGRVGIVARGVVFTIVGLIMVAAALHAGPHESASMNGALIEILRQPFGRALLAAAALGLIAFGAYSVMCARWMRIRVWNAAPRSRTPRFPSP